MRKLVKFLQTFGDIQAGGYGEVNINMLHKLQQDGVIEWTPEPKPEPIYKTTMQDEPIVIKQSQPVSVIKVTKKAKKK